VLERQNEVLGYLHVREVKKALYGPVIGYTVFSAVDPKVQNDLYSVRFEISRDTFDPVQLKRLSTSLETNGSW
jgi:hypothetical protein